jgi:hypothetical protein
MLAEIAAGFWEVGLHNSAQGAQSKKPSSQPVAP